MTSADERAQAIDLLRRAQMARIAADTLPAFTPFKFFAEELELAAMLCGRKADILERLEKVTQVAEAMAELEGYPRQSPS